MPSPAFGVAFCCAQRVVPEKRKAKNKNIEFIFHNYINYLLRKSYHFTHKQGKNTIIFPTFAALKHFLK